MSRRKRLKLAHQPLHHYPPLLLSPIIHDDQHHSLPAYPTPSPAPRHPTGASQTPPPKTSPSPLHPRLPPRPSLTPFTSLLSTNTSPPPTHPPSLPPTPTPPLPSSPPLPLPPSYTLLLSCDPYLLADDDLPDPDTASLLLTSSTGHCDSAQDGDDGVPGTPLSSVPSTVPPPVQRSLSYEEVGKVVVREGEGGQGEGEGEAGGEVGEEGDVVVRTISIPPLLEGLDDYPSLRDVQDEEEEEEARRREALEREMAAPWSELLDDADEEEEEWERRMQGQRQRRREDEEEQCVRGQRQQADMAGAGDDDEELRPTAVVAAHVSPVREHASVVDTDEMAVTQVAHRASSDWVEPSQSQTQLSTPPSASSASPAPRSHRPAQLRFVAESPSSSHGGEEEEGEVAEEAVVAPAHRFSRRIFLSNSSSTSATPV